MSCQTMLGLVGALLLVPVQSQRQFISQTQVPPVFRSGVDLFVVDAVVTDREGRPVTDLSADDFDVVVDGRPQRVQHAIYLPISSKAAGDRPADGRQHDLGGLLRGSSAPATPAEVGRTMAIVVDDLGLSFESTVTVREALGRFIDGQMAPGDLVAILRTSAGIGSLQQFTTDRRLLHAAAQHVQWTGFRQRPAGAFDDLSADLQIPSVSPTGTPSTPREGIEPAHKRDREDTVEGLRDSIFTAGMFGALEFAIRGVAALPGRKSVVLMSDGFDLDRTGQTRTWDAARRLIETANRAGVVLYTIDARGLQTVGATAEMGSPSGQAGQVAELMHSQDGLLWLAHQTGGIALVNNNDLNLGLSRVLADQAGYYLVGFEGRASGNQALWEPGRVRVRVHRDGLQVRWRQGQFGPAEPTPAPGIERDRLAAAAMSPFVASDVLVKLTPLFGYDARSGPYLNVLLLIDPAGLTFTRTPTGGFDGDVDVLAIAADDSGQPAARLRRRLRMRVSEAGYTRAQERGLLYSTTMRIARPGGIQVRAALRDAPSGHVGSASQFVEVPGVGPGKLAVSGIVMNAPAAAADPGPLILRPAAGTSEQETETLVVDAAADTAGVSALRVFSPGSVVVYASEIYAGLRTRDRLTMSTQLLRDGRPVYETAPSAIGQSRTGKPVERVPIAGSLVIGRDMPEGMYTLQVTVVADRPGRRDLIASRWADFDVERARPPRPASGRP